MTYLVNQDSRHGRDRMVAYNVKNADSYEVINSDDATTITISFPAKAYFRSYLLSLIGQVINLQVWIFGKLISLFGWIFMLLFRITGKIFIRDINLPIGESHVDWYSSLLLCAGIARLVYHIISPVLYDEGAKYLPNAPKTPMKGRYKSKRT